MLSNNTTITVRDNFDKEIVIQDSDMAAVDIDKSNIGNLTISEALCIAESKFKKEHSFLYLTSYTELFPEHRFIYNDHILNDLNATVNTAIPQIEDQTIQLHYMRCGKKKALLTCLHPIWKMSLKKREIKFLPFLGHCRLGGQF